MSVLRKLHEVKIISVRKDDKTLFALPLWAGLLGIGLLVLLLCGRRNKQAEVA
uniref:Uncharacterized protein n=1 Tax=Thermosporothrix sp. COM3 TaxID=2490863 RepID=A0A455SWX0_9CHLR|nr:hypothetical protein KTC_52860 [Thermosporothrix sp. COM3]